MLHSKSEFSIGYKYPGTPPPDWVQMLVTDAICVTLTNTFEFPCPDESNFHVFIELKDWTYVCLSFQLNMETNALWFMLFQFIENEATTFWQLTLLQSSGDIAHSVGSH